MLECLIQLYSFSTVDAPPLKDCSEVFRMGLESPGVYKLDPSGDRDAEKAVAFECEDGWTRILVRDQFPNGTVEV